MEFLDPEASKENWELKDQEERLENLASLVQLG